MAPEGTVHQATDLIRALPACIQADKIASQLRREKRQATPEEEEILARAEALRDVLIQVDVFDHLTPAEGADGYVRPALQGTADRMASLDRKNFVEAA